MSIFKLPRRRSPEGHLEHGVYVSMIPDTLKAFHVDSKVYLGARQALHNHWLEEAEKIVGELGGELPYD